jgi:hypothetical protein
MDGVDYRVYSMDDKSLRNQLVLLVAERIALPHVSVDTVAVYVEQQKLNTPRINRSALVFLIVTMHREA